MKSVLASMVLMLSVNAYAKDSHLICMTGDIGDMDIKIESTSNGKEKLSVILTAMDGVTVRTFVNSNFSSQSLSDGLKNGKIQAIVSKSDLQASFGGAFLDAGVLELNTNAQTKKQDVIFAAEGIVYTAACTEQ
ncbi:hypothetical protein [Bdellovibrio sp. HCB337]|uniref:hypothetical protein n=1 Tax=Bdellovibrio sp. HCB337 TaxID=3394358 RepID=UPI0039A6B8B2